MVAIAHLVVQRIVVYLQSTFKWKGRERVLVLQELMFVAHGGSGGVAGLHCFSPSCFAIVIVVRRCCECCCHPNWVNLVGVGVDTDCNWHRTSLRSAHTDTSPYFHSPRLLVAVVDRLRVPYSSLPEDVALRRKQIKHERNGLRPSTEAPRSMRVA
jgi:hypothetical protein